ncbi:MAG: hypothetical protein N2C14_22615 [Planctomycetales bacterium]
MVTGIAEALAALCLVALAPWLPLRHLSMGIVIVIVVWLLVNFAVWKQFSAIRRAT